VSTTYKTRPGDTFESVSRRVYGTERYAPTLAKANPGLQVPLTAGTEVYAPTIAANPVDVVPQAPSAGSSEVSVLVGTQRFRFWTAVRVARALDAVDTVEFAAPFDPDDDAFRDAFRPFTFKNLTVSVGGDPLFTGTLVGVNPVTGADRRTVSVSGYATPGVLNDCTPPASAYPLEFNNLTLEGLADALCEPFGVPVVFNGPAGAAFERVAVDPGQTVLSFLAELAKQRGLVISSTPTGAMLFQKAVDPGAPVAILVEGASPVVSVTPFFSPQEYYSHITGLQPVVVGTEGSQYTVKNPHLAGLRPMTFRAPDVEGGDIKQAVEAKAGRMLGNAASYSVSVASWRDPKGKLWRPNTTVMLHAPGAMVYQPYEFVVRSVLFDRDSRNESAELNLVLPGAFSGQLPEALPWEE